MDTKEAREERGEGKFGKGGVSRNEARLAGGLEGVTVGRFAWRLFPF